METQKFGFVALLGRPNAGKSTLLNALVGEKLAVVSRKPQTTRDRIAGIVTVDASQLVFLDTPGLHRNHGRLLLNEMMLRTAYGVAAEADVVVYAIDLTQGWTDDDATYLKSLVHRSEAPIFLVATKRDRLRHAAAKAAMTAIQAQWSAFADALQVGEAPPVIMLSAKMPETLEPLRQRLASAVPAGPWPYAADALSDQPEWFFVSEYIREQLFRQLGEEIPYQAGVEVTAFDRGSRLVRITADVVVARASHQGIVVGRGGQRIREIGTAARTALERYFGTQVFLDLKVRVGTVTPHFGAESMGLGPMAPMPHETRSADLP